MVAYRVGKSKLPVGKQSSTIHVYFLFFGLESVLQLLVQSLGVRITAPEWGLSEAAATAKQLSGNGRPGASRTRCSLIWIKIRESGLPAWYLNRNTRKSRFCKHSWRLVGAGKEKNLTERKGEWGLSCENSHFSQASFSLWLHLSASNLLIPHALPQE